MHRKNGAIRPCRNDRCNILYLLLLWCVGSGGTFQENATILYQLSKAAQKRPDAIAQRENHGPSMRNSKDVLSAKGTDFEGNRF